MHVYEVSLVVLGSLNNKNDEVFPWRESISRRCPGIYCPLKYHYKKSMPTLIEVLTGHR